MIAFMWNRGLTVLLIIVVMTPVLYIHTGAGTPAITPSVLSGSFTWNPSYILAGGNDSFTGTASGGLAPYKFNWTFGDSGLIENGSFVTHIYKNPGSYTARLNITDSTPITPMKITVSNTVTVNGTPIALDGWQVNWKIALHHGVEIYNASYNGLLTIRDAVINGILVNYPVTPPGQFPALFYDDLGKDDLNSSIGGFTVTFSSDPANPWFQIRAMYNFANVGYNYTQLWRFYTNGRWDAIFLDGHSGLAWNHIYQPQYRFDLVVGNKNNNLMSQYTPSGVWQNLVWEGNYTDNGFRDAAHNSTEWRIGDGKGYYYIVPSVASFARDMPLIAPKIYLVKDHPGELMPDGELPSIPPDPIVFANGELAYRQDIAFWYLPSWWDHWLQSPGPSVAPPSVESISFYPNGV